MQAYYSLDYEGVSVKKNVFPIYFTGCNFRCPYCNTPSLVDFKDEHLQDLKTLKQRLREEANFVDAVIFTGGEPTLQRLALIELAQLAKKLKLKVGLDTNGSKPMAVKSLLNKKLLDFISLDIKAPLEEKLFEKVTRSSTFFLPTSQLIQDLKHTIELLDDLEIEVKILIVPGLMYKKEDVLRIASLVQNLDCRVVLAGFSTKCAVLSKKFMSIKPPSEKFLKNLQDSIRKKFPNTRVYIQP